ncbi:MAG: DUF975 family protein [Clostridiales Family XIII bacterium]|jgi:uncharacterized membrane protein|nr:DUF975 family protein [Clostridiales Family XIII bacterium]
MNNIVLKVPVREIRKMARESLTGRWKIAILGALLYLALILVPTTLFANWSWARLISIDLGMITARKVSTDLFKNLYTLVVTGPMTLGFVNFSFELFRKREGGVGTVLSGFSCFFKPFGLFMVMNLFIFLWSLLLIIPGIIAMYRYSMAFLVMADKPDTGVFEALRESKRIMKGNKFKLFRLQFSFMGWILLTCSVYFALLFFVALIAGLSNSQGVTALFAMSLTALVYANILIYVQVAITAFYELACGNRKHDAIDADFTVKGGSISSVESAEEKKKISGKDSAEGLHNPFEEKKE